MTVALWFFAIAGWLLYFIASGFSKKLITAIRLHRDQKLDERCWLDDFALYNALPEGLKGVDMRQESPEQMLQNCQHYIAFRSTIGSPEEAAALYKRCSKLGKFPPKRFVELKDVV